MANGTDLCMLDIRVITGHESDARCFLSWKHNITHLTVDANQNKIYFTDDVSRRIQKHDIVLNVTSIIATTSSVSGINMLFSKNLLLRFTFSLEKIFKTTVLCKLIYMCNLKFCSFSLIYTFFFLQTLLKFRSLEFFNGLALVCRTCVRLGQ